MEVCMDSPNKFEFFLKTKWPPNRKIEHNSLITWATESRFYMEICMDSPKNIEKILKNKIATKSKNKKT